MTRAEVIARIRGMGRSSYCYALLSPESVFYVGAGSRMRIFDHERQAKDPARSNRKVEAIRAIWGRGLSVGYEIIAVAETLEGASEMERQQIEQIGRLDLGTGLLTNRTAGGLGMADPDAAILGSRSRRCRAAWAKRDKAAGMAHLASPEIKQKAAAARRGKKRGPYAWKNGGPRARRVEIAGKAFLSIAAAAREFDVTTGAIHRWLKEGKRGARRID